MSDRTPDTNAEFARVGIVVDASCDVPASDRVGAKWRCLPETWHSGDRSLSDVGEQSSELLWAALEPAPLRPDPIPLDAFVQAYDELADCECVLSVHSSASISPNVDMARSAARGRSNVHVVESNVTGLAVGLLASRLAQRASAGDSPEQLLAFANEHARAVRFLVVPDSLIPHGRQRPSAMRLLTGRTMMSAGDGTFATERRLRTRRSTLAAVHRYFSTRAPAGYEISVAVGHADAAGAVDPLLDVVERVRPQATIDLVGRMGPRIVRQLGARCLGLAWIVEAPDLPK